MKSFSVFRFVLGQLNPSHITSKSERVNALISLTLKPHHYRFTKYIVTPLPFTCPILPHMSPLVNPSLYFSLPSLPHFLPPLPRFHLTHHFKKSALRFYLYFMKFAQLIFLHRVVVNFTREEEIPAKLLLLTRLSNVLMLSCSY